MVIIKIVLITQYPPRCMTRNSVSPPLTCASLDALRPCMLVLCVADISAVLEPSTATSATAEFAGFLGSTTFGAGNFNHG